MDLQEIVCVITTEDVGKFCVSVADAKKLLEEIAILKDMVRGYEDQLYGKNEDVQSIA